MRTTINIDDDLLAQAAKLTGSLDRTAMIHEGLKALIERESARRLARLGGTQPNLKAPAHGNFKRPRGRRSAAGLEGLELAELTPGLLLWPDSTGSRRFARSSFGIDIRVSPWFVGIELTCGAAPPWLRWQRTLVQDSSDGRRGPGGFSPAPPRVPALWVAAADPAPGG